MTIIDAMVAQFAHRDDLSDEERAAIMSRFLKTNTDISNERLNAIGERVSAIVLDAMMAGYQLGKASAEFGR